MARRRRNTFIDQAAADALVRYGPELSALAELRRQAVSTSRTSIRAARSAGADIQRSVRAATPQVRGAYSRAQSVAGRQQQIAAGDLAGLPADSPFRAAAAIEQTGLRGRLAESRAGAIGELGQRSVAAAEGTRSATQAARSELANALTSVFNRRVALAREQGAFTASTAMQLFQQARKDAQALAIAQGRINEQDRASRRSALQSERSSLRSAGVNPDTGRPIRGGPLDPNSPLNRSRGRANRPRGRGGAGAGGKTRSPDDVREERKSYRTISTVAAQIRVLQRERRGPDWVARTLRFRGFYQPTIEIAYDLVNHGGRLSPYGAKRARRIGILNPFRYWDPYVPPPVSTGRSGRHLD